MKCCDVDHTKDAPGSRYYVSVRDDSGRYGFAAGPYATHGEAIASVEDTREVAYRRDGFTHFYEWGTARVDADAALRIGPGILNAQLAEYKARGVVVLAATA